MRKRILLADDRTASRELVATELGAVGHEVTQAVDGEKAWDLFFDGSFDLVVTDLRMPHLDGLGLLHRIRSEASPDPDTPVVILTSFGTLSGASAAGRAGVTNYFPLSEAGLSDLIACVRDVLGGDAPRLPLFLTGSSPSVKDLRDRLAALARIRSPVLLRGEDGTGKVSAARHLHRSSPQNGFPFHHVKYAPEQPEPGVFFVDHIDELSQADQIAWGRLIGVDDASSDLRLIGSARTDLLRAAAAGRFEPSLARKLARHEVVLPPLRERLEDIPQLAERIISRVAARVDIVPPRLGAGVEELLREAGWPDNLHTLEDVLEALMGEATGGDLSAEQVRGTLERYDPAVRERRAREVRERQQLLHALHQCEGKISRMAEMLGVDRHTIRDRLRKHGLRTTVRR